MDKLAFIVPTGIGASIGGFAGDAGAYARKLSEKFQLIVNPNVVNAACFSAINENMLYVEGYALDLFFKRKIALRQVKKNKIGVIFDKEIPNDILNIHLNTLAAMKSVYGIDAEYICTEDFVGIEFLKSNTGISTGIIKNAETLLNGAKKLIDIGCNAIAPVCLFDDCDDDDYISGTGIDIVGGVEAVISHLLTKEFLLPVAHAPAFRTIDISKKIVSPKVAAEYITPTFLPCIVLGLYKAPQLINIEQANKNDIVVTDLRATVMPYNSLGSTPVFKSLEWNIPVYAVKENNTVLNVNKNNINADKVIIIDSYDELFNI